MQGKTLTRVGREHQRLPGSLALRRQTSARRRSHTLYELHMTQTLELKAKARPFPHIYSHTPLKEAVLSAAPWLINQMDSGEDEGVGGGWLAARDGKAPVAWRVILISDYLISPMAFWTHSVNTPARLVVRSIICGVGTLLWLSSDEWMKFKKDKLVCLLMTPLEDENVTTDEEKRRKWDYCVIQQNKKSSKTCFLTKNPFKD